MLRLSLKLAIIIIIFSERILVAQNPTLDWVKGLGNFSNEFGKSVVSDASGNVYVTGIAANGSTDFDPGPGVFNISGLAGNISTFILKLNSSGNFVWVKAILGGAGQNRPTGLAIDNSGNVYVTGFYNGSTDFDPGPSNFNLTSVGLSGQSDIYVLKLDASGNFLWAGSMGGTGAETSLGISVDNSSNVYLAGRFSGTVDFAPGVGTVNLTSITFNDSYCVKLLSNGSLSWVRQFNTSSVSNNMAIATNSIGDVFLNGTFQGVSDFDPGISTFTMTTTGGVNTYLLKLNTSGGFLWAKNFGGNGLTYPTDIVLDNSGDICFTGFFDGAGVDFDPATTVFTLSANAGTEDVYVTKVDALGNLIWAKQIGGNNQDNSYAITVDANNDIYLGGYYTGIADFDPGVNSFTIASSSNTKDIFVTKINGISGGFIFARSFGSTSDDVLNGITVDANQNIISTGFYEGTVDFDPGSGVSNLVSFASGGQDVFIQKMGQCATVTTSLVSQINVLCNGGSTGSASISASGGSGFTYNWIPTGGNTSIASGLNASTYSCVVTNSCGSSTTQTLVITQPPALTLTVVASNTSICVGSNSTLTALGSGGAGLFTYTWVTGPTNSVHIVTPTSTSIYTINTLDANNCSLSKTVSILVHPNPTVTVNSGAICSGNSFTLSPAGAATYTIQGGSNVVSPTSNASYTVAGTSSAGCVSNIATSNVTVNPLPTITATSSTSLICSGQAASLTASGANTYTWSNGPNTAIIVISPSITTNYTVTGTNANGCSGFAVVSQSVSACTSIDSSSSIFEDEFDLKLYPNPTHASSIIEFKLPNTLNATVFVYDVTGRVVESAVGISSQQTDFKLELNKNNHLKPGVYFISIMVGNNYSTKKLVIN